jgi:hypothetical protein
MKALSKIRNSNSIFLLSFHRKIGEYFYHNTKLFRNPTFSFSGSYFTLLVNRVKVLLSTECENVLDRSLMCMMMGNLIFFFFSRSV